MPLNLSNFFCLRYPVLSFLNFLSSEVLLLSFKALAYKKTCILIIHIALNHYKHYSGCSAGLLQMMPVKCNFFLSEPGRYTIVVHASWTENNEVDSLPGQGNIEAYLSELLQLWLGLIAAYSYINIRTVFCLDIGSCKRGRLLRH